MEWRGGYSVADVAKKLSVDKQTVRRWLREKRLEGNLVNGRYFVAESSFDKFVREDLIKDSYYATKILLNEERILSECCKKIVLGIRKLEAKELAKDHKDGYLEGWMDAMGSFEDLIKDLVVEKSLYSKV